MRFFFVFIFSFGFVLNLIAAEPEKSEKKEDSIPIPLSQRIAVAARFSTALVHNYTINVFNPAETKDESGYIQIGSKGSGSAVVFQISQTRGLLITNRHVVRKNSLEAQKLFVSFYTRRGNLKKIPAKIVKIFDDLDMAILEFDPQKLPRGTILTAAKRPSPEQLPMIMGAGRPILIQGNPLGETGWTSDGVIASRSSTHMPELFGIAASINPGNSGGPIFDKETGLFLGLSTSKLSRADGMGYATPVELIEPYFQIYKDGDPENFQAYIRLGAQPITLTAVEKQGSLSEVTKAVPELVGSHKALIVFNEPAPETGLENLDYLLSINGKVIGPDIEQLYRIILSARSSHIKMKILRGSNILDIDVPLHNLKTDLMKRESDFVIAGGLFIQDMLPYEIDGYAGGHPGVIVTEILNDTFGQSLLNRGLINRGTLIQSVRIDKDGAEISISNLGDLKKALASVKIGQSIQISVHRSGFFSIPMTGENQQILDPLARTISLPISETIYTDSVFSLADLKANFPFPEPDLLKMKWRDIAGVSCTKHLTSLGNKQDDSPHADDFQI